MKKSKISRVVVVIVVLMLALSMFSACANDADGVTDKTVLTETAAESSEVTSSTNVPAEKLYVGVSIRSLSSPYMVQVKEGAEMFVEDLKEAGVDAELNVLTCEGSDDKQINDIKALIARGGKNTILYVDANQAPNSAVIADICEDAGVFWASVWNIADGLNPMDYEYYVCHTAPDDELCGYQIAVSLFESFETPGKGKVVAIDGMLANTSTQKRAAGMKKALEEYPDIELVEQQNGDWDPKKALSLTETWLSKYDDLDGIWTACDCMALGAVQALQNADLNGQIHVVGDAATPEAVDSVKVGDMTATWAVNGWLQGYYMLAWPYAAYTGEIDVSELPAGERKFYTPGELVGTDSVADYEKNYIDNKPVFDYKNIKEIIVRAMEG